MMTRARRALTDSALALMVACGAGAMFLPPMVYDTVESVPKVVALGITIALGLGLHWVCLGIAASRLQRSVLGWVACAVVLVPVGGIAALLLLGGSDPGSDRAVPAPSH